MTIDQADVERRAMARYLREHKGGETPVCARYWKHWGHVEIVGSKGSLKSYSVSQSGRLFAVPDGTVF